jgi:hypothetical protein
VRGHWTIIPPQPIAPRVGKVGRASRMGRVVEGADADLVVLDANPIASVQNMHRIAGVEH